MKKAISIIIIILVIILISLIPISRMQKRKQEEAEKEKMIEDMNNYLNKEVYGANEFTMTTVSLENALQRYYSEYKNNAISNPEKAFKLLDSNYREKRFANYDDFLRYTQQNVEEIMNSKIIAYLEKNYDGYNMYTCLDQNNNYIIFKETAVMQYSIILDPYTLDMPEFLEKYNSTDEQGKTALNIQKFTQALSAKDYRYAYNHLSGGFKSNYFKSQEDFERYINDNWYNCNFEVEYGEFEEQSGLYKYTITIKNKENQNELFQKTIIMKLNEGTNFEMSFNV